MTPETETRGDVKTVRKFKFSPVFDKNQSPFYINRDIRVGNSTLVLIDSLSCNSLFVLLYLPLRYYLPLLLRSWGWFSKNVTAPSPRVPFRRRR